MKASDELFTLVMMYLNEKTTSVSLPKQNGIFPTLLIGDIWLAIDGCASVTYQDNEWEFSKQQTDTIRPRFELIHASRKEQIEIAAQGKVIDRLKQLIDNKKIIQQPKA